MTQDTAQSDRDYLVFGTMNGGQVVFDERTGRTYHLINGPEANAEIVRKIREGTI